MINGLAIDIDPKKIETALRRGIPMIRLDATNMHIFNDNACLLVSIVHTLEHLPNLSIIEGVLKESVRVANRSVYIKGPMFYKDYLAPQGYQFFWSHWKGHTCHVEPDQIIAMMKTLGCRQYKLNYIGRVVTSTDPCIHPINGHIDRHEYDPLLDPPKPMDVAFTQNIFKEFEFVFTL